MWTGERHLLADLVDLGQVSAYLLGVVASQQQFKKPPVAAPKPVERPGVKSTPERKRLTPDEFFAWFGAQPGLGASA